MSFSGDFFSGMRSRKVVLGILICVGAILLVLFAPFVWAPASAESIFDAPEPNLTEQTQWDLLTPQYAVYAKNDDFSAAASFVQLERNWLIFWDATQISQAKFAVPDDLSDEEKAALQDQNLDSLRDAVQNNRLTADTPFDSSQLDELTQNLLEERERNQEPGRQVFSIEDIAQTHTATVVNGLTYPDNSVLLDGTTVEGVRNVASLHFETSGDSAQYVYFTDFTSYDDVQAVEGAGFNGHGTVQFSGKVKRINTKTLAIETVFTTDPGALSVRANTDRIVVFTANGKGFILDTDGNEVATINTPHDHDDQEEHSHGHGHSHDFVEVVDIGQTSAIIQKTSQDTQTTFRVDLSDGSLTEIE